MVASTQTIRHHAASKRTSLLLACAAFLTSGGCQEVTPAKAPPIADAGVGRVAIVGTQVTLDGTGSHTVDGRGHEDLQLLWSIVSKPEESGATLSDESGAEPWFIVDAVGEYIFRLVATDKGAESRPDVVVVWGYEPLAVIQQIPPDRSVDVRPDAPAVVVFSAAVQPETVTPSTFYVRYGHEVAPGLVHTEEGNTTAVFEPLVPYPAGHTMTVVVTEQVVSTTGVTLPVTYQGVFAVATGPDTRPPAVYETNPEDGAEDVAWSSSVEVAFDEPMDPDSLQQDSDGDGCPDNVQVVAESTGECVPGTIEVVGGGTRVIFTPDGPLTPGETYIVTIEGGADGATDTAGNPLPEDVTSTFTVSTVPDTEPPQVVSVYPGNGYQDVPLGVDITLGFSEAIDPVSVDAASLSLTGPTGTQVDGTAILSTGNTVVMLVPGVALERATSYAVTVRGDGTSVVTDLAGNSLDGNADGRAGSDFRSTFVTVSGRNYDGLFTLPVAITPGTTIQIQLADRDLDTTSTPDPWTIRADSTNGESEPVIPLTETAATSGIFEGSVVTVFGATAGVDGDNSFNVAQGDVLTFTYNDAQSAQGVPQQVQGTVAVVGGMTGVLTVGTDLPPGHVLTITLEDSDQNVAPGARDSVPVTVVSSQSETESVTLLETSSDTGIFRGDLPTVFGLVGVDNDGTLSARAGDTATTTYEDPLDENGSPSTVAANTLFRGGTDGVPTIVQSVFRVGDVLDLEVVDTDDFANTTSGPSNDTLDVSADSVNTNDRLTITLDETGTEGEFTGTVVTAHGVGPITDTVLQVSGTGETVTLTYTDMFWSDGDTTGLDVSTTTSLENSSPVISTGPSSSAEEGTLYTYTIICSDPDSDPLALGRGMTDSCLGVVVDNGDGTGTYSFTPTEADGGTSCDVVVTCSDGIDTASRSGTVNIQEINQIPVATDPGAVTTDEDVPVAIVLTGADAEDPEDQLTIDVTNTPNNGTLDVSTGSALLTVTYTPNAGFDGNDTFEFTVTDTDTAVSPPMTVAIDVNGRPVVTDPGAVATDEDVPVAITLTGTDTEDSESQLTVDVTVSPSNGSLNFSSGAAPLIVLYTPNAGYSGSDSFEFTLTDTDSAISTPMTVDIYVNGRPVATHPGAVGTDEDIPVDILLTGTDDEDQESDLLVNVTVSPTHGTLSVSSGTAPLTVTYTPDSGYGGSDSITFTITDTDGAVSTPVVVNIGVGAVNDIPVATDPSPVTTNEEEPVAFNLTGTDVEDSADLLTVDVTVDPSNGTLSASSGGAPLPVIYTPDPDFNGTDTFEFTVTDTFPETSIPVTVTVTVNPINDVPVAVDDNGLTIQDNLLSVGAPGVLSNDIDIDLDVLSAVLDSGVSHGTLTLNPDGSYDYMPDAGYEGPDSFTYFANDGMVNSATFATVGITVAAVNDPPAAVDDSAAVDEDNLLSVAAPGVLANDTDPDLNPLTAVLDSDVSNGTLTLNSDGSYDYQPDSDFEGTDSFTYFASDGLVSSPTAATVTINVNAVNDAPVAVDDSAATDEEVPLSVAAPGVLANDTDVESDPLTAVLDTAVSYGTLTLNADGSYDYQPDSDFEGIDSFTYFANDGTVSSTDPATVTITVNGVNDAPVAVADGYSTDEDTVLTVALPGVLANDTDIDLDSLTVGSNTDVSNGTLTLNADGSFTYMPDLNFVGTDGFTYIAHDGTTSSASAATVTITVNAVNDAPVAVDDGFSVNEDTLLTVAAPGVLGNDTDVEGNSLTVGSSTDVSNGTLTLNADGSFTYMPDPDFDGTDTFTYFANDGAANSATAATVTITVNGSNDAPVPVDDNYLTMQDGLLTVAAPGVLDNDIDADSDPLTVSSNTDVSNGTLTPNADGSFTYMPDSGYEGTDTFTYYANDGTVDSATFGTVTITVSAVNDPPVAVDDSFSTDEETVLSVPAPGVLGNDTDPDNNPLTAVLDTNVSNGTLLLGSDGSFLYVPDADFAGTDSFTYFASDGLLSSATPATVTITVNPINDAPVAVDDSYSTDEDTPLMVAVPGVLANDSDIDSGSLTATLTLAPANGTLTLNGDGSFAYAPNLNFNGSDSFTYVANDGALDSNVATVDITVNAVNDAPVATDDGYSTGEDTPLVVGAPGVLANDSDVDSGSLTAAVALAPSNGTLTLNADGSFTYTPDPDFEGSDSFTYVANDGALDSNIATVDITVTANNDAPVAVDDSFTTDEDTPLNVAAPGVLGNDSDVDSGSLTAVEVLGPNNGTLTLNADGSFTYTPDADFNGSDSFTYQANDGTLNSNLATVDITVNAVNDPPVAVDDSYSTDEDTPLNVAAPGVLGNDSDVDSGSLTVSVVSAPGNGALTLNGDGSFAYTPDPDFEGSDSFTYVANDGALDSNVATVTITVNAVNDAPVAVDDSYSTDEDTPLNVAAPGVLGNDSDVDSGSLNAVVVAGPTNGTLTLNADGSFGYTPDLDFNGSDSFTYVANDGALDSNVATVDITVNVVNDAPVATDDSYSTNEDTPLNVAAPGVLGNDSDVDSGSLTAAVVSTPSDGTLTLNGDGSFTYTPDPDFEGSDSFTYVANDGALDSNVATVTITVNAINDAPVAADDSYSMNEDTPLNVAAPGVLGNDSDVDSGSLTPVLVSGPANGTLTLNGDGSFTYTPDPDFNGSDSFTYEANDGALDSNVATVDITVNAVNDAPVAVDDGYSTDEDTPLIVGAPGVLGNDSDVDSGSLTASLVSGPANGVLTFNADGSFTYTPSSDFNGTDSFTYVANDGALDSNLATVTITVNTVNDAPVAGDDSYSTDEDTPLVVSAPGVLGNDSDVDSGSLTAVLVSGPSDGTLTLNGDGSFTYTPDPDFNGSDSFTYEANDGALDSNVATVDITVNAVNDVPEAVDDGYATDEETQLVVPAAGVLSNDTDVENNPLTVSSNTDPANGTLTLNADGSFTYMPDGDFAGTDTFTYYANDGTADSATAATVTITVANINDAPVAVDDSYLTMQDQLLSVALPGVLGNDLDADSDPLTVSSNTDVSNGTLTLNGDGSFDYLPDAGYEGTDSFTYYANDGTVDSGNFATVTITVAAVNDPPVAVDDSYSTNEESLLMVPASGVLGNDSDPDLNPLTAALDTNVSNGTLVLAGDGSFMYMPNANFQGTDSFTYVANDGALDSNVATVTITVNNTNDDPTADNDSATVNEDSGANSIDVLANDTYAPDPVETLTITSVTQGGSGTVVNNGTNVTYAPNADFFGVDTFTYTISDGNGGSDTATVTVTVNNVNDNPDAADDSATVDEDSGANVIDVLANDSIAPDTGETLSISGVTQGGSGTVVNNGTNVTYAPNADFFGVDTFTYTISDGNGGSDTATVTVTVNNVNDAPTANDDSPTVDEDSGANVIDVLANDSIAPDTGETLSIVTVTQGSNGTVANNGTNVSYTPNADFFGSDTFTYTISDGNGGSDMGTVSVTVSNVNDNPTANDDSATVDEDSGANVVDVLANDSIAPDTGETLSVSGVTQGGSGTVVNNGTNVTYAPNADFFGVDTFTYTISDGNGGSDTATVTVTVNNVNDDPTAIDDSATVNEDSGANVIDVLANDTFAPDTGETLSIVTVTQGGNGTVVNGGTDLTYAPNADFFGIDTFTYTIGDGNGGTDTATVTVTVTNVNDDPTANDDSATVDEDSGANVIDVLANDSIAPDTGETLSISGVTQGANGTVVNNGTNLTYAPNADFFGGDTFTYTISDGNGGSDTATVTVTVNNVNDDPTATNDSTTVPEDSTDNPIDVLANDSFAPDTGETLTIIGVTQGGNGSVANVGGASVTYTPNADFFGVDTFTYTISDGNGGSDTATVTVTVTNVNDDPTANDDSATVDEDSGANVIDVLANDSIAPDTGETLSISGVTQGGNGTVVNNGTNLTYAPNADFFGVDTFTYTISDGNGGSDTAAVTVTVNNVNDDPTAIDDSTTVSEDSVANPIDVLANDTFAPDTGETLTITGVTQGTNGSVANVGGASVTYTPNADFFGVDTFTYTVGDGNGGSDTATVTLTVTNVNDDPTATDDSATVAEDSGGNTIDVLANDTFAPDTGETLTITGVTQGGNGTVVNNGTDVTYTPNGDFFGVDTFTYTIGDGNGGSDTATVTVTVTNVNDDPTATDDTATVAEDSGGNTIDVLANDTFAPDTGETLTITGVTQGGNGTVVNNGTDVTYTPNADFFGGDTFTYTIGDGNGGSDTATVTVTVTNVNDDPTATDDTPTVAEDSGGNVIDVLANDTIAPDTGETLSISGVTQGSDGTVVNNGTNVTYSPDADFFGVDTFTYTISDGNGGSDTATVTVTVSNVNDDPTANDDSDTVSEDSGANTIDVLANDSIAPDTGETLTISSVTQGSDGSVANVGGTTVTYTPDPDFFGVDTFTYTIGDGNGGTDTATVTVTVTNVNDDPTATDDTPTVAEDSGGNVIDVLANDTIAPDTGETLSISGVTQGSDGTVVNNGTNVTYSPDADFFGVDTFTYTISDGNGGSDTATVTVTVSNVNDDPTANDDSDTVSEDSGANTIDVLANDSISPDTGETLTISSVTQGSDGSVANVGGTTVTYTPDPDFFGVDTFTYTIGDGNGGTDTATVTVTVTNVNDDPTATDDTPTVAEDSGANNMDVLANDTIAPDTGETLSISGVTQGSDGTVVNNGTNVTYTPDADSFGVDTFTYTISDGNGGTDTATVTVTVSNVNDDPTANDDSATVDEDSGANTIDVLANDSIAPDTGETLTISSVTQGGDGSVANVGGTTVTYTPDADFFGVDTFTYTISDGNGGSDTATVTVTVTNTNDNPDAVDDSDTVVEDSAPNTIDVLANDTDAPDTGETLTVTGVTQGTNGTVVNNTTDVTYEPAADFAGVDTFTYTIGDGNGGSDTATVTVTVTNTNDNPDAIDDSDTVVEDSAPNTIDVLANDT
ncbi:Ig-like domain-containing protein, partial [Myxococcota bacterium]